MTTLRDFLDELLADKVKPTDDELVGIDLIRFQIAEEIRMVIEDHTLPTFGRCVNNINNRLALEAIARAAIDALGKNNPREYNNIEDYNLFLPVPPHELALHINLYFELSREEIDKGFRLPIRKSIVIPYRQP